MLRDFDRQDHTVGGDSAVTVESITGASRSFSAPAVAPGASLTVTITAAGYGQGGAVTETLPDGFTYGSSSLPTSQISALSGNMVRFTLQDETSFTYTVTAPMTEATYTFSGTLRDFERQDHAVGGDSSIVVEIPSPRANRSFSSAEVEPGATLTVTIDAAYYGQGGAVTETLPAGFAFVSSSLPASQVAELGQTTGSGSPCRMRASFTYTVTASQSAGTHTFSGMLRDFDRQDHDVGGDSDVTVMVPDPVLPDTTAPTVSWNLPQVLTVDEAIRPIRPTTADTDIASYAIEDAAGCRVT